MSRVDEILDILYQQALLMDYETKDKDITQAKSQLLKHLCDKVDGMKKELYLYSSGEFASDKTETFNQALDEVKQMLKGEML